MAVDLPPLNKVLHTHAVKTRHKRIACLINILTTHIADFALRARNLHSPGNLIFSCAFVHGLRVYEILGVTPSSHSGPVQAQGLAAAKHSGGRLEERKILRTCRALRDISY